jgi:hypothetical protein
MKRIHSYLILACASLLFSFNLSCNDHPVEALDQVLSAVNRVENRLPARTKLDFLFVIDNSGSMCEEQERLADNFKEFSNFLFDELQDAADYRIAVTSTDMQVKQRDLENSPEAAALIRGRFLYTPARPENFNCNGAPPPTEDCPTEGDPIINSLVLEATADADLPPLPADFSCEEPCDDQKRKARLKAKLERDFKCRATVAPTGLVFEKGLESMRYALSCKGPNADKFAPCCENLGTDDAYYNPACVIDPDEVEPEFLRPDATLVVIFISDENDCSTPADFPEMSSRLICRPDGIRDENNDGMPDIYTRECGSLSPEECYRNECKDLGSTECKEKRCDIKYDKDMECEWYRGRLTPIVEYRDFLQSLKANPLDQILVAPIVGFRAYTELGNELKYNLVQETNDPSCDNRNSPNVTKEICCPDGACAALQQVSPVCNDIDRGILAYPGTRYLQLAEELGENGLGCNPGTEPEIMITPDNLRKVVAPNDECLTICVEDFVKPLNAIKDQVANLLSTYCIQSVPACRVPALIDETGSIVSSEHSCETVEEFGNVNNYSPAIRVSKECINDPNNDDSTQCAVEFPRVELLEDNYCQSISSDITSCDDTWKLKIQKNTLLSQIPVDDRPAFESYIQSNPEITSFIIEQGACPAQIELKNVPGAGSEVLVEFLVDIAINNGVNNTSPSEDSTEVSENSENEDPADNVQVEGGAVVPVP